VSGAVGGEPVAVPGRQSEWTLGRVGSVDSRRMPGRRAADPERSHLVTGAKGGSAPIPIDLATQFISCEET
jgi:hypothetical protein